MPPAQLQTALTNAFDHPGPLRLFSDEQVAQLRQLAASRGISLGNGDMGNGQTGSPGSAPPVTPVGNGGFFPQDAPSGQPAGGGGTPNTAGGVATPQAAFKAGRDPGKHAAYWADHGWHQNEATGVWHGPNGQKWDQPEGKPNKPGQPGPNGPTNDPNGPQSPGAGGQGTGTPAQPGAPAPATSASLPLDPQFEASRRVLDANMQRQLSAIAAAGSSLSAEEQLALARLATNEGVDVQQLLEDMAKRGTMESSIYTDNRGLLATDYARQHQDLALGLGDARNSLALQAGDAQGNYEQQLIELLSDAGTRALNDPNAMVDAYPTGGGGGGGNWKPTWKPKWKPPKQRQQRVRGNR